MGMPPPVYPKYGMVIVGLSPGQMKTLKADDVATLVEVFKIATGVDALATDRPLAEIWAEEVNTSFEGR